eukprot:gene2282-2455_t
MIRSSEEESVFGPQLEIYLIQGIDLAPTVSNGKSSPYIIFKAGEKSIQSKTIHKNLSPSWGQSFVLPISNEAYYDDEYLEVECYDFNRLQKDKYMGGTKIKLSELEKNKTKKFLHKLDNAKKGTLVFELTPKLFDQIRKPKDLFKDDKEETEKVFEKLKLAGYEFDNDTLMEMSENLSDIENLKKNYLPTNWIDTLKVHNNFVSSNKLISKSNSIEELTYDEFEEIKEIENLKKDVESIPKSDQFEKELKIKIIFVDQMGESKIRSSFRKLLSPILSDFNVSSMGLFHTALLIGPWYLEWNDSGLCIPRSCTSKTAFLSADIGEISSIESLETIREKIAKIICEWNVNFSYQSFSHKKNEGNCQDFVEIVLGGLNLKFETSGVLEQFLTDIKKNGNSKLRFPINSEMQNEFNLENDSIQFKTHSQLDEFYHSLLKTNPNFHNKYQNEYKLLKSFDRAFWLRNFKTTKEIMKHKNAIKIFSNKKISEEKKEQLIRCAKDKIERLTSSETYLSSKPYTNEEEDDFHLDDCPFGDPAETKSFWVQ